MHKGKQEEDPMRTGDQHTEHRRPERDEDRHGNGGEASGCCLGSDGEVVKRPGDLPQLDD
jgi:hypothetical protein